jgi:hypothetical protein
MDTKNILADLRTERKRIDQAIAALESLDGTVTATTPAVKAAPKRGGRRRMSAAGRKRISEAAKARWAAKRMAVAKPVPQKTSGRRTMSPAARKKIAEAQRKRWAVQKKAAVKKPANKGTAGKASAKKAEKDASDAGVMGILKSVFQ